MLKRGVVPLVLLVALTVLTVAPALAQDNRPRQSQVCSVVINVIVNNQPIQVGGNDVIISGDANDLSNNQTAMIAQYFDISPTIVQNCLQKYDGENGGGDNNNGGGNNDEDDSNGDGNGANDGNSTDNKGGGTGSKDNGSNDNGNVSDDNNVDQGTIPNKDLPDTGGTIVNGATLGVFAGVGFLVLITGLLMRVIRFRKL